MLIPVHKGLQNLKVLVIDDDVITQRLLTDILGKLGFTQILSASNAYKGLEVLAKNEIDFIISDWRMPGMSGIEFTRNIRALPYSKNKFVNIIMLTGNAEIENIIEARDAGVTEYLIKPFTIRDFCDRIIAIVENPREFVVTPTFQGPTRRRRNEPIPGGVERRKIKPTPEKNIKG